MSSLHILNSSLSPLNIISNEKSLAKLLFQSLSKDRQNNCLIDTGSGRRLTRGEVLDKAINFSNFLKEECCLNCGEVVFFVSNNSDIHAIALIGVLFADGVYSSAPFHSTQREIEEISQIIKPKITVLNELSDNLNINSKIIILSEELFNERNYKKQLLFESNLESIITLVLSSGSSGCPKAISKTNLNILSTLEMFSHQEMQPIEGNKDILLSSGFCHICGQKMLFSSLVFGSQLAIVRNDENHENVFKAIKEYSVTTAVLIPTQLNWLVKNQWNKDMIPSLNDVMTGAAPLSTQIQESIEKQFEWNKFRNSYGMSESGFVSMVPLSARKSAPKESVGQIVPGMEVKIVDIVTGVALPCDQVGEVCIRGDQVSCDQISSSDGFLYSGDFGFYDSKGFLFIVSRIKDLIKSDGVLVSPSELEHVLMQNKEVTSAAVIGVEDDERGHVPIAFVTLSEGAESNGDDINDWLNQRVNAFKQCKRCHVISKMPKTHSGKIRKSCLKEDFY